MDRQHNGQMKKEKTESTEKKDKSPAQIYDSVESETKED